MGKAKVVFGVLLLSLLSGNLYSRTREEVISDAGLYSTLNWTVGGNNILDEYDHKNSTSSTAKAGRDGIDDRAFVWSVKNSTWVYSTSHWPFYTGKVVDGEAYAFAFWDTTTTFKSQLLVDKIAGARQADSDADKNGQIDASAINRYTGIDCSGMVARVWGFKSDKIADKIGTYGIDSYSIEISSDKVRAGDVFNRPGHHSILIDKIFTSSAAVIHSIPKSFVTGSRNQDVISETIKVSYTPGTGIELYDAGNPGWYHYTIRSAFPQLSWLKNGNITDTVKVRIESGTKINTGTIRFVIDWELPTATTVYADELTVTSSNGGNTAVVEYNMATDLRVSTGPHAKADKSRDSGLVIRES